VPSPAPRPDDRALYYAGRVLRDPDGSMPAELRSKAGRALVSHRWAATPQAGRDDATRAGRDAVWQRFLDAVPAEVTDSAERERLAGEARRAHMRALAVARAAARIDRQAGR